MLKWYQKPTLSINMVFDFIFGVREQKKSEEQSVSKLLIGMLSSCPECFLARFVFCPDQTKAIFKLRLECTGLLLVWLVYIFPAAELNMLAKLGDAIAISNLKLSITD